MRQWLRGPVVSMLALAMTFALTTTQALADQRDFTLFNDSSVTITHVYVSASHRSDWGDDLLGSDVLLPGDWMDFEFDGSYERGSCYFDIRIRAGSRENTEYDVNLCTTSTVTFH